MKEKLKHQLLTIEMKAWLKHRNGTSDVVRILPDDSSHAAQCYQIYTAYGEYPGYLGRILFDQEGCWIYDGHDLDIAEQEQLANFILRPVERRYN
ncbi:hypothetical protein ABDD95_07590 [Mucilaginibacter sp. PAMB04274]|uniref:hypothetical protein n=1 Tax=Mucilaginibacter sp. PAMB04274 TaxID=3138568 RepID=UPI0031F68AB4